jgi:hypothetical protein
LIFFPGLVVVVMIKTTVLSDCVTCQDDFYFRKWPVSPAGIIRTGQSVELECRVSAEDRISISWTLNGELLINSSRRYQNSTTGALVIRRADHRLDSGDFACTATNVSSGFSIASQLATLMIHCKLLLLFNHNQLPPNILCVCHSKERLSTHNHTVGAIEKRDIPGANITWCVRVGGKIFNDDRRKSVNFPPFSRPSAAPTDP